MMVWLLIGCLLTKIHGHSLPPVIDLYDTPPASVDVEQLQQTIRSLRQELRAAEGLIKEKIARPKDKITKNPTSHQSMLNWLRPQPSHTIDSSLQTDIAQKAWQTANHLIKAKQYLNASEALQDFLTQYPKHPYQADAYYLLAQLALLDNNPSRSLQYSKLLLKQHPNHKRIPEAHFQMGLAYHAQNNKTMAYKTFMQLQKKHPNHPAALKAKEELKQLQLPPYNL